MAKKMPDLMFFCEKGHIVAATNEAETFEINQVQPCPCGSNHFRAVANWPEKGTEIVPKDPIRMEKSWLEEGEIQVFDVSKLFSPNHEPPIDINWDDIPDDLKSRF